MKNKTVKTNMIETCLEVSRYSIEKVNNLQYKFYRILIFMHTFARSLVFLFLLISKRRGCTIVLSVFVVMKSYFLLKESKVKVYGRKRRYN